MFRILSLDGGGTRGTFSAACLAGIEARLDHPIANYFDLVVATSTGSIIALPLTAGVTAATIEQLYLDRVYEVFAPHPPYFSGVYKPITWATSPFLELFTGVTTDELIQPKYSSDGLRKIIKETIGDITIAEISKCRLNITAVDLQEGCPVVFKTPHFPSSCRDRKRKAVDIILAATAAPTYFNPITIEEGTAFCDGALWANNPGIVGYSEATNIARMCKRSIDPQFKPNDIRILSVGTGFAHYTHQPPQEGTGVKWWARRVMEIMFNSQSQSTSLYLQRLLPLENFHRLDFEITDSAWIPIDALEHIDEMAAIGHQVAEKNIDKIHRIFFQQPTTPYTPFDPDD